MKYPIINGELPSMAVVTEYHLISPSGIVVGCFDDRDLAISRMVPRRSWFKSTDI
jgi:hypothetical protein